MTHWLPNHYDVANRPFLGQSHSLLTVDMPQSFINFEFEVLVYELSYQESYFHAIFHTLLASDKLVCV